MKLHERANCIRSREDLVIFIRALKDDLRDHSQSWENADLGRFLEALSAWIEDMDGYYLGKRQPVPEQPDWKFLGEMLLAARIYE